MSARLVFSLLMPREVSKEEEILWGEQYVQCVYWCASSCVRVNHCIGDGFGINLIVCVPYE